MAGLLEIFRNGGVAGELDASGHSRKLAGLNDLEVEFTAYNVQGAAQELHLAISAPLPYFASVTPPLNDVPTGGSNFGG